MPNIIKVKFLKEGQPQGRPYTYFTHDEVQVGDLVQVNLQAKGIVVETGVTEEEIKDFKDKVKFIHGLAKEDKE